MVVLTFNYLALMLFELGRRDLEDLHIDDVVSTIYAVGLVAADEHPKGF
jgi:hypothetical protein